MRLRSLRVRRFRRLRSMEFDFHPGLNVILGPNEAGKSTLREAIITSLYGNAATTSPTIREGTRSWGEELPAELVLEFEADGEVFTLTKDFHGRRVLLSDSRGRKWEGHTRIQKEIGSLLGLSNENVFRATAHVAQAEIERLATDQPDIARELSRIMTGGGQDANVMAALKRLGDAMETMKKGLSRYAKEPGPIRRLEEIRTSLANRRNELRQQAERAIRSRQELGAVSRQLEGASKDLAAKEALLKVNQELLQIEERLKELRKLEAQMEDRIKKIHENFIKLQQIDREIEELGSKGGIPEEQVLEALRSTQLEYERGEALSGRLVEEVAKGESSLEKEPHVAAWVPAAAILFGGSALVMGMILSPRMGPLWGAGWAGLGVIALLLGIRLRHQIERRRAFERQLEELRRELEKTLSAASQAGERIRQMLEEAGCASIEEFSERLRTYQNLVRERTALVQSLQVLQGERSLVDLREDLRTIQRDIFGLTEHLRSPEVAGKRLIPLEVQRLEDDTNRLRGQVRELEQRKQRLEWEIEHFSPAMGELAEVEERMAEVEERLGQERFRLRVYEVTYEGLQEANRQAMIPARDVVASMAGEYLRVLTGGRYNQVRMVEGTLQVQVWVDEAERWIPPREPDFSRGAIDQVYLATRLALVEVLAGGKSPPLVLDDPFVHFDEERLRAAMGLLRDLSSRCQVLLFTCRPEYADFADHLIPLVDTLSEMGIQ